MRFDFSSVDLLPVMIEANVYRPTKPTECRFGRDWVSRARGLPVHRSNGDGKAVKKSTRLRTNQGVDLSHG
jgi:hypothetical protein